jgi:hypothetical protein
MSRASTNRRARYLPPWPLQQLSSISTNYDWTADRMYYDGDTVRYQHDNWYCMYDHLGTTPPTEDAVRWRKLTSTRYNPDESQIAPFLPSAITSTKQVSRRAFWPTQIQ